MRVDGSGSTKVENAVRGGSGERWRRRIWVGTSFQGGTTKRRGGGIKGSGSGKSGRPDRRTEKKYGEIGPKGSGVPSAGGSRDVCSVPRR